MKNKKDIEITSVSDTSGYKPFEQVEKICDICKKKFMFTEIYVNKKGDIWNVVSEAKWTTCESPICIIVASNTKKIEELVRYTEYTRESQQIEIDSIRYQLKWHTRMIIWLPLTWLSISFIVGYIISLFS